MQSPGQLTLNVPEMSTSHDVQEFLPWSANIKVDREEKGTGDVFLQVFCKLWHRKGFLRVSWELRNKSSCWRITFKGGSWWNVLSSPCYPHFLKGWNNKLSRVAEKLSQLLETGVDWCMTGRRRNRSLQVAGLTIRKYHGYWSSELTLGLATNPGWQWGVFSISLQQKKK